ncbi:hypothetical protein GR212_12605 [Rhizobium lusitanum]|uniref:Uncharacterized protein n=1 Tax=Rhizobium lusitanum TaxID=293958 RepID=A0A6L9U3A6_9HYPH|nr:hypothetical protein [Rhizobium lusitanum]NEI70415.1 hypothetical protein [Rhizobium lusitanum]
MVELFSNINWLEWSKVIFDLLKGVAWPLVILFVVLMFRREVRERIKDIVSVGPSGAVLQPSRQIGEATPPPGLSETKRSELAETKHPLATVQALIEKIDNQLANIPSDDRIQRLVASLAEAQIERQFEFIWGIIFGSQIAALRRLKLESISIEDAKKYFEEDVKPIDSELYAKFDFNQWSRFLLEQGLVAIEDGHVSLTDSGRDFLAFIDLKKPGFMRAG